MDPDSNLAEQRRLVKELNEFRDADELPPEDRVWRLVELVEALDEWIMKQGALPVVWHAAQAKNLEPKTP